METNDTTQDDVDYMDEAQLKKKKKSKPKPKSRPTSEEYVEYKRSIPERHTSPNMQYYPPPSHIPYYPPPQHVSYGGYPHYSNPPPVNYQYSNPVPQPASTYSSDGDYSYDQNNGKFYFKPRRETLNWRVLLSLNLEKIMDKVDIDTLESITKNLTFSRVDFNDLRYFNETNFVQIFRLSQLIIEYLLYVQNYLSAKKKEVESNVKTIISDLEDAKSNLTKKTEEINYLKKELKRKKKAMYAYECVFGTNPEKAKILQMSQNQPQPQQVVRESSSTRSDKEETFGELRGEIRRLQENLFSQLEDTIEKKQKVLERENQKRLDQFQKEFEKFTDSCKYQQENLYSALSKSISKYTEEGNSGSGNSDDFLKFSSQIQNLIQQNNQLMMSSFDRKMNDLSASAKQQNHIDNSAELNEMKKKLDELMRSVNNKPEPVIETVVRKVVKSEPPKEDIVTVVKAKPRVSEQLKPIQTAPVVVKPKPEPKVEPPQPKPTTPVVLKPKPEPVVERPKTPLIVKPKPVEKPIQRVETPPTRVKTPPPPKPKSPEPASFVSDTTETDTDSSEYTSSTNTSMTSDNSNLGLRERIYKELKLGKVFDELDESISYQHFEEKPWLKAKYKQNPKFIKLQNSETDQVFDNELRVMGVDPSQAGMTESEYVKSLNSLQKSRGNIVNNNPDHLVIMNSLRDQVDKIASERLNGDSQNNRVSFAHDPSLNDFINKLQKINDYEVIRRIKPNENPPDSQKRHRLSNAEDSSNDVPKITIPNKDPKMLTLALNLMKEAQQKKREMDERKNNIEKEEDESPSQKPKDQMNTLKSTLKDNKQLTMKSEDGSLNNTKIIEADFDDVTADHNESGSTFYEVVAVQGEDGGEGEETEYSTEYETETEEIEQPPPKQVANPSAQVEEEEEEEEEEDEEERVQPNHRDQVQTFVAPESDEEEEDNPPMQNVNSKSESNMKKQMELESEDEEEEQAIVRVVSKVSKVKIENSDESDEGITRGGNVSNQALGNKFKNLNNMWDDINNKKRPSKLNNINKNNDSSIDLPGSDDFDISAFKQNLTPNSRPGTAYSSDISGFIKTLKNDEDDLDTEEL